MSSLAAMFSSAKAEEAKTIRKQHIIQQKRDELKDLLQNYSDNIKATKELSCRMNTTTKSVQKAVSCFRENGLVVLKSRSSQETFLSEEMFEKLVESAKSLETKMLKRMAELEIPFNSSLTDNNTKEMSRNKKRKVAELERELETKQYFRYKGVCDKLPVCISQQPLYYTVSHLYRGEPLTHKHGRNLITLLGST